MQKDKDKHLQQIAELKATIDKASEQIKELENSKDGFDFVEWYYNLASCVTNRRQDLFERDVQGNISYNLYPTETESIHAENSRVCEYIISKTLEHINDGWVADWNDEDQRKVSIFFNHAQKFFDFNHNWLEQNTMLVFAKNRIERVQAEIDKHGLFYKALMYYLTGERV